MSLFDIAIFIGVLKNQPFTPNFLFPLMAPSHLTLQSYLKQDTSVSFSFPPPIFHTNHSQLILPSLANPSFKMFHISVHFSSFPQWALWFKYNFMSELPDRVLRHVGRQTPFEDETGGKGAGHNL